MMNVSELVPVVRLSIGITSVLTAFVALAALRGRTARDREDAAPFFRASVAWAVLAGVPAVLLSHTDLVGLGVRILPVGALAGVALGVASLFWGPARRAFDRLRHEDVQAISSYRTIFGAFLFAGAGLGLFPPIFALLGGTGDLVAGWLATVVRPTRAGRLLVHGFGAADFVDVLALGVMVVRPWLVENASPGPSLLLPWIAVPVLFTLNIHGLRTAITESRASGAVEDGLEPARGV